MTDVFISYKKEDVDRVRPIAEALAQAGYDVWWDHRIPPGRTYRDVIGAALQTAKCVVVVWSEASTRSQWVLDEADVGAQRRVLLPILIDSIMPPLGFTQIEAARLVGWTGDTEVLEWKHTIEAVAQLVGREPGAAPPVSIAMPSSGGGSGPPGYSPAVTLATPGAALDRKSAEPAPAKKGGGAAALAAALVALAVVGGGGYYAVTSGLFSGSLPPADRGDTGQADAPQALSARVFLHIGEESQRPVAEKVADMLRNSGHVVEGIQNVGERSPRGAGEARYFSDASAPFAKAVSAVIEGTGLPEFAPVYNPNHPDVPIGHVELYFSYTAPVSAPAADPEAPASQPTTRFGDVNGRTVKSVTVPASDGSGKLIYTQAGDGSWLEVRPDGTTPFRFSERNRTDTSVELLDRERGVTLVLDLARARVTYATPEVAAYDIYEIIGATSQATQIAAQPPQGAFAGINGTNVMSVVTPEGPIGYLKDGYWGAMGENGLPENTFKEVGRDEWSVYIDRVPDGARFRIDTYLKGAYFFSSDINDFRRMFDLESASTSSLRVPQITDAKFFMFGPEVRFERVEVGPPTIWQEYLPQTGQWAARWKQLQLNGHFMELTDDGRGARMRVDLIQGQVYLYFPDWGEFKPQWKITEMQ